MDLLEEDKNKDIRVLYPLLVSSETGPDLNKKVIERWDKFDLLSENNKEKISSQKTASQIYEIKKYFNISLLEKIAPVSRAIRSYYFGEMKLEDMPFVLAKEMNIDLTKAKEISQMVINKIINDNSEEKSYQDKLEKLTIPEALKKYPEIGEQLITENRIKVKNFPEPVRPSLKNWLADYVMLIGRENRDSVKRGSYLFQSENGKNISSSDRQRLSYILKCLDENTPITINKLTKQIVFPQISENNYSEVAAKPLQAPVEPKNNIQSVQFSYPQKSILQKPVSQPNVITLPKTNNQNQPITERNVVNLKD